MNEKLIDNIIQDYSLRELQIISSIVLSKHDATSNFIKQFKADHDSQQFYKNVIKWHVKKYEHFPETPFVDPLTFHFVPNNGGLGDRFVMVSTFLSVMDYLDRDSVIYICNSFNPEILFKVQWENHSGKLLCENFYQVIDFFHFKRPKNKITTVHLPKILSWRETHEMNEINYENTYNKDLKTISLPDGCNHFNNVFNILHNKIWTDGTYWPIDFPIREKRKKVCYIFYDKNHDRVTEKQRMKIEILIRKFPKITFFPLEDLDYARNVEILQMSNFIFATEGMWTHLSRAMNVYTIAHTTNLTINKEINSQGHSSSPRFDKCLEKAKNLCTDLMK